MLQVNSSSFIPQFTGFVPAIKAAANIWSRPGLVSGLSFIGTALTGVKQVSLEQQRSELIERCKQLESKGANQSLYTVGSGPAVRTITVAQAAAIVRQALSRDDSQRVFLFQDQGCGADDEEAEEALPVLASSAQYVAECREVLNMLSTGSRSEQLTEKKYDLLQRLALLQFHEGEDSADSIRVCSFDPEDRSETLLWVQDYSLVPVTVTQFIHANSRPAADN